MVELGRVHLVATKHMLRNLEGTNEYDLRYARDYKICLQDMLTLIGMVVLQIGRALQVATSIWHDFFVKKEADECSTEYS